MEKLLERNWEHSNFFNSDTEDTFEEGGERQWINMFVKFVDIFTILRMETRRVELTLEPGSKTSQGIGYVHCAARQRTCSKRRAKERRMRLEKRVEGLTMEVSYVR